MVKTQRWQLSTLNPRNISYRVRAASRQHFQDGPVRVGPFVSRIEAVVRIELSGTQRRDHDLVQGGSVVCTPINVDQIYESDEEDDQYDDAYYWEE